MIKILDTDKLVKDVSNLSLIFSTKPLNREQLAEKLKEYFVSCIAYYEDMDLQKGLRAYNVLCPNLGGKKTYPISKNSVSLGVTITEWGRSFFVEDTELITLFSDSIAEWFDKMFKLVLSGRVSIPNPGELFIPTEPIKKPVQVIHPCWTLRLDPRSYELLSILSDSTILEISDVREYHSFIYVAGSLKDAYYASTNKL